MVPVEAAHHASIHPQLPERVSRLLMRPWRLTIARSWGCNALGVTGVVTRVPRTPVSLSCRPTPLTMASLVGAMVAWCA